MGLTPRSPNISKTSGLSAKKGRGPPTTAPPTREPPGRVTMTPGNSPWSLHHPRGRGAVGAELPGEAAGSKSPRPARAHGHGIQAARPESPRRPRAPEGTESARGHRDPAEPPQTPHSPARRPGLSTIESSRFEGTPTPTHHFPTAPRVRHRFNT